MDTHLDDLESGYHVQVGEVKDISCKLLETEMVMRGKLVELCNAIIELKQVHQKQRMHANERNEARYGHLKEILEELHA